MVVGPGPYGLMAEHPAKNQTKIMDDYITPDKVTSPRRHWSLTHVLEDGAKPDSYGNRVAIAIGKWDESPALGMRWNGSKGKPIGSPQSRGLPVWYIVPRRIEDAVIKTLSSDNQRMVTSLLAARK
jgi:hypothetical protein